MDWFTSVLLLAGVGLAIGLPVMAWGARLSFTRLNYIGLAIGSATMGALSLVIAKRGTDAPDVFATISVLLLATSFGAFMAIFFYRKPSIDQEHGSPDKVSGAALVGPRGRSSKVTYFAIVGFLALATLGVLAFRSSRTAHRDEPKPQLSSAELGKVKLDRVRINDVGFLEGNIYNGSSLILTGLRIQINIYGDEDKIPSNPLFSREYRVTTFVRPEESDEFIANVGFILKQHQSWKYKILEGTGMRPSP